MFKKISFMIVFLLSGNMALAWDGTVTGAIKQIDVATLNGDNSGFRVTLVNTPSLCGNENTWAYVNKSDDNYQAAVSVLLAAKMAERSVTIYSNQNGSNGYCHLGYVVVR